MLSIVLFSEQNFEDYIILALKNLENYYVRR